MTLITPHRNARRHLEPVGAAATSGVEMIDATAASGTRCSFERQRALASLVVKTERLGGLGGGEGGDERGRDEG